MTAELVVDEDGDILAPVPAIYADRDCRGFAQRAWAFEEWCRVYGSFGCIRASHGWHGSFGSRFTDDDTEVEHCQPAVMQADLSCHHDNWRREDRCFCVGGGVYRGMCLYCDWEGEIRGNERYAVEDAHDHAWPGWRDLPLLKPWPDQTTGKAGEKAKASWWAQPALSDYPTGWIEQGGPILTRRRCGATRHSAGWGHPFGGYDMCGEVDETVGCGTSQGGKVCTGLANGGCISKFCRSWYAEPDDEEF